MSRFTAASVRACLVLVVLAGAVLLASPIASAQTVSPTGATPSPGVAVTGDAADLVVLSGSALVPRGQIVGEVVVFHGRAVVLGVSLGDVVVLDGSVTVAGQVSGSVIAVNGPVHIMATASVRGDVKSSEPVRVDDGATVEGTVNGSVAFTPRGSLSVLGGLLGPLVLAGSVLLLGLALLLLVPRGADRIATAVRTAPLTSAAWGLVLAVALPVLAVALVVTIVGLPVGLALLLALALVFLVGATWTVWAIGRAIVRDPRSRPLAFVAGWAIAVAISLVPYLNVAAWTLASILGLGAMSVATWRARGTGGRHRAGATQSIGPPETADAS